MSFIQLRDFFAFVAGFCVSITAVAVFVYKVYVVLLKAFSAAFKKHIDPIIASVTSQIVGLAEKLEEVEVHHEERYRNVMARCDDTDREVKTLIRILDNEGKRIDEQQECLIDLETRMKIQERLLEERTS